MVDVKAVRVFDGMDRDDVRVIEGGDGARFATETLEPFGIGRQRVPSLHRRVIVVRSTQRMLESGV